MSSRPFVIFQYHITYLEDRGTLEIEDYEQYACADMVSEFSHGSCLTAHIDKNKSLERVVCFQNDIR
jgi:hypothetical protein